jgi:hypothetical protein
MFRAAVRKAAKRLLRQVQRVEEGDEPLCAGATRAAAAAALLAQRTCAAVEALQQV